MNGLDKDTVDAAVRFTDAGHVHPDDPDFTAPKGCGWEENEGVIVYVPYPKAAWEKESVEVQVYMPATPGPSDTIIADGPPPYNDVWELTAFEFDVAMVRAYWQTVTGAAPKDEVEKAIAARTIALSILEGAEGGANPGYYEVWGPAYVDSPFIEGKYIPWMAGRLSSGD